MEKLKDLVDKKLFTLTILPKLSNKISYTEYSKQTYNHISNELDLSINENLIFTSHFTDHLILIHPDTNKTFLIFTIHYTKENTIFYVKKFLDYNDDDCEKFFNEYNKLDYTDFTKITKKEFRNMIKILCDNLMICGHKLWSNSYYNKLECPLCIYENKELIINKLKKMNS
jgi:hypothetical protein